tara:strand:- start:32553 stop:33359 length:807 start_codon:yes stop_codon:yes gene_type:complete
MSEWWALVQQDYIIRAFLVGIGVSLMSGPLGVFVIWQRLAFFGDTLAHSGLLGVTIALAFHAHLMIGVACVAIVIALLLLTLREKLPFSYDAILGILSPTILAVGLIALSSLEGIKVDVLGFLIGDILAVDWWDIASVFAVSGIGFLILMRIWSPLIRCAIDQDLAAVEGVKVKKVQFYFVVLLALFIALAVKIVGVLLITAFLIIPAATSRFLARSPEQMAAGACLVGAVGTFLGINSAIFADWPVGPAIVVSLAGIFTLFSVFRRG